MTFYISAGGGSAYGGNPATTIEYKLPSVTQSIKSVYQASSAQDQLFVSLKVYDMLGREVATLVNEYQRPGNYQVNFSAVDGAAESLPSGVYFYKLIAGDFIDTKKMLLVK